jgi:predicted transcriptional regulator
MTPDELRDKLQEIAEQLRSLRLAVTMDPDLTDDYVETWKLGQAHSAIHLATEATERALCWMSIRQDSEVAADPRA